MLKYLQAHTIGDLRFPEIQAFIDSLIPTHEASTINTTIIAIRSFLKWLSDTYSIPNLGIKLKKLPKTQTESRCLDEDEYAAVLAATQGRLHGLIIFLGNTGLRPSEMIKLTPKDLNGRWLTVDGKGRKKRIIYLNESALETVHIAIDFTKSYNYLYQLCRRAAVLADIKPFGPHALRHRFITAMLTNPQKPSIHHVSRYVGHANVKITEAYYYHFRPEHLSGLTDCLDP